MKAPPLLFDHQGAVEAALAGLLDARSDLPLYRMMRYQLGWLGQDGAPAMGPVPDRLYGAVCIEAAGRDAPHVRMAAAAAELLYQSALVHEEMQTADGPSGERPAVWWLWGPAQAINVGDGLHALARLALLDAEQEMTAPQTLQAVALLDASALRYYEGHYLDLTYQERLDVTEAQYVAMASAKRGALFGAAAALGALAAGYPSEVVQALQAFGEALGLAAQMRDDVNDVWPSTPAARPRVLNKSKLLPIVHAFERAPVPQKRALGEAYFKRVLTPADLDAVRAILEETGSRAYAEEKAQRTAQEALAALDGAGLPAKQVKRWREVAAALTDEG